MMKKYNPVLLLRNSTSIALLIGLISLLFTSCKVYKPAYYFQDITRDTVIQGFHHVDLELKIKSNDLLDIAITSLNTAQDALFNTALVLDQNQKGFLVDDDGNIYLHKLGKIQVAGLTRKALKQKLETELAPFLKDPIVSINFSNHRVTVFGETKSQVVPMPEEKISLLEVLAISSPTTLNSKLNQVLVIRDTAGAKQFKHLNLENYSIITSPWYYLQPNDVVVVKPNGEKIESEAKRTRNQILYTSILSGITFVILIIDRITR